MNVLYLSILVSEQVWTCCPRYLKWVGYRRSQSQGNLSTAWVITISHFFRLIGLLHEPKNPKQLIWWPYNWCFQFPSFIFRDSMKWVQQVSRYLLCSSSSTKPKNRYIGSWWQEAVHWARSISKIRGWPHISTHSMVF